MIFATRWYLADDERRARAAQRKLALRAWHARRLADHARRRSDAVANERVRTSNGSSGCASNSPPARSSPPPRIHRRCARAAARGELRARVPPERRGTATRRRARGRRARRGDASGRTSRGRPARGGSARPGGPRSPRRPRSHVMGVRARKGAPRRRARTRRRRAGRPHRPRGARPDDQRRHLRTARRAAARAERRERHATARRSLSRPRSPDSAPASPSPWLACRPSRRRSRPPASASSPPARRSPAAPPRPPPPRQRDQLNEQAPHLRDAAQRHPTPGRLDPHPGERPVNNPSWIAVVSIACASALTGCGPSVLAPIPFRGHQPARHSAQPGPAPATRMSPSWMPATRRPAAAGPTRRISRPRAARRRRPQPPVRGCLRRRPVGAHAVVRAGRLHPRPGRLRRQRQARRGLHAQGRGAADPTARHAAKARPSRPGPRWGPCSLTAGVCGQQHGRQCRVYVFTDGVFVGREFDARRALNAGARARLAARWADRLAGLDGAEVRFIGVGYGTHASPRTRCRTANRRPRRWCERPAAGSPTGTSGSHRTRDRGPMKLAGTHTTIELSTASRTARTRRPRAVLTARLLVPGDSRHGLVPGPSGGARRARPMRCAVTPATACCAPSSSSRTITV